MGAILPFNLQPSSAPDLATAYWRSLVLAAGYVEDAGASLTALAALAGASAVVRFNFPSPLPDHVYLLVFPAGVCVTCNGTTQLPQFVVQTMGAVVQVNPFGLGGVNSYDLVAAVAVLAAIAAPLGALSPARVLYCGHSLGGAVAQLLAQSAQAWPVVGAWTIGQPRVGTAVWANAYARVSERYTTTGDPVPLVPPSQNPLIDITLQVAWPFPPASYQHAGTRRHVDVDGLIDTLEDAPSWIQGTDYIRGVVLGQTGWYGAHSCATYASRIRQGIPVPWLGSDPAWPLIGALDALAVPLLGPLAGVPSAELFTDSGSHPSGVSGYATEGICE